MPALVAGIHVLSAAYEPKTWMAGTSPAMTQVGSSQSHHLKHRVGIGGLFGDFLTYVPVLDHLAVFQTENVDDGVAAAAGRRHVVDVQDHIIAVGKDALDIAVIVGKLLTQIG